MTSNETTNAVAAEVADTPLRLDLGAGGAALPGYVPIDIKEGRPAFPLAYESGTVDEIRSSHLLEHFPHHQTLAVLAEWMRVLKPGGLLKISVPDFEQLIVMFASGTKHLEGNPAASPEAMIVGGQADGEDTHRALFTETKLRRCMMHSGVIDIERWESTDKDCSSFPISLNLQGRKMTAEVAAALKSTTYIVRGALSHPRYGAMSHHNCASEALRPFGIQTEMCGGPYWGKAMTAAINAQLAKGECDAILTLDYDTIFEAQQIYDLIYLLRTHPEVDAIAPVQHGRTVKFPLMSARDENGDGTDRIAADKLAGDLFPSPTAHFGLTLIRASSLRKMAKPWFKGTPSPQGEWDERSQDADIWFWTEFERQGFRLMVAPRVVVGHTEEMIIWPNEQMKPLCQRTYDYMNKGRPEGLWK